MPFQGFKIQKISRDHAPGSPYGNVLSLYRQGPWAPSRLKWQGP